MSTLLTILAAIASIIVLMLVAALFVKKKYAINRSITINKPVQQVFDYIRIQRNQEKYSKWVMTDPDKKVETRGTDGTKGFVYAWNGNKRAGEGEVEIMGIEEGKRVDTEVRFIRPFTSSAQIYMTTTPAGNEQTKVEWGFDSEMKYPLNLMLVMMGMEKLLGRDMEVSLNNLKQILEA
jgi:uncharacterized protein YndB with AHSA1/START domain